MVVEAMQGGGTYGFGGDFHGRTTQQEQNRADSGVGVPKPVRRHNTGEAGTYGTVSRDDPRITQFGQPGPGGTDGPETQLSVPSPRRNQSGSYGYDESGYTSSNRGQKKDVSKPSYGVDGGVDERMNQPGRRTNSSQQEGNRNAPIGPGGNDHRQNQSSSNSFGGGKGSWIQNGDDGLTIAGIRMPDILGIGNNIATEMQKGDWSVPSPSQGQGQSGGFDAMGGLSAEDRMMLKWRDDFFAAHGYYPESDPELLSKGMNPEQSLAEHLAAKEWGEGVARGMTPDMYPHMYDQNGHLLHEVYRHDQPMRFYGADTGPGYAMAGGFEGTLKPRWFNQEDWSVPPPSNKGGVSAAGTYGY